VTPKRGKIQAAAGLMLVLAAMASAVVYGRALTAGAVAVGLTVLLGVGAGLLLLGLRGRRVGEAPHCRRCGYNLTGLSAARCSECGTALGPRTVATGRRERRAVALAIGASLTALALTGLGLLGYGHSRQIDWYRHYTVRSLTDLARNDDVRALNELVRRAIANELAARQLPRLIEAALDQHGAPTAPPHVVLWADLLAIYGNRNALSAEQRDRFCRNLVIPKLAARPVVRVPESFAVELSFESRWSARLNRTIVMTSDGPKGAVPPTVKWPQLPVPGFGSIVFPKAFVARSTPGRKEIEWPLTYTMLEPGPDADKAQPVHTWTVIARATTDVLPADSPDPIRSVPDADLTSRLRQAIVVDLVKHNGPTSIGTNQFSVVLRLVEPMPMCIAVDVLVVIDAEEHFIREAVWEQGKSGEAWSHPFFDWTRDSALYLSDAPATVLLKLRTSREAARHTLDCYEVWEGELLLGPVPVTPWTPADASTQPAPTTSLP